MRSLCGFFRNMILEAPAKSCVLARTTFGARLRYSLTLSLITGRFFAGYAWFCENMIFESPAKSSPTTHAQLLVLCRQGFSSLVQSLQAVS